ncbi:DUF6311 domain-containing protein [Butyrivibrio sp. XPD2002]|uniref:DUF6311 domain-containing protein n=1 Tax=Butyrivibrio sp. XPD2002 TaxID=1280665 RepID=UPI0003FEF4D7|nr:DUF6311 domain-containing protein [Butyrivibrio sp. XPD2002]
MDEKRTSRVVFAIGALIGAAAFLIIYGFKPLDVTDDSWIIYRGADLSHHYIGWLFYRNTPWRFPVGLLRGLTYPDEFAITYMDSIPLFAIFFKLLSPLLPETFQYFGIYGMLVFALQGGLSSVIIFKLTGQKMVSMISSGFFSFSSIMIQRMFNHTALACNSLILTMILLFISGQDLRDKNRDIIAWTALLMVASLVHLYYIPMTVIFILGFYFHDLISKEWYRGVIKVLIPIAATLLVMYVVGDFYGGKALSDEGLGYYNSNLTSLFDDQGGSYFYKLLGLSIVGSGSGETFAYIGFGVILMVLILFISSFFARNIKKEKKDIAPLLFIIIAHLFMCTEPEIRFGKITLLSIEWPEAIYNILSMFRANGRFMWPVFYLFMIGVIVKTSNRFKKWTVYVIGGLLIVQLIDLYPQIKNVRAMNAQSYTGQSTLLQAEFWERVDKDEIYLFYTPHKHNELIVNTMCLGEYAAEHNMVMNDFYVARKDDTRIKKARKEEEEKILKGKANERYLYVFSELPEDIVEGDTNLHIYEVDGMIVGVTEEYSDLNEIK